MTSTTTETNPLDRLRELNFRASWAKADAERLELMGPDRTDQAAVARIEAARLDREFDTLTATNPALAPPF